MHHRCSSRALRPIICAASGRNLRCSAVDIPHPAAGADRVRNTAHTNRHYRFGSCVELPTSTLTTKLMAARSLLGWLIVTTTDARKTMVTASAVARAAADPASL